MANIPSTGEKEAIAHLQEYSNQEIDALVKKGIESNLFSSFFNTQYYPEGEFNYMAFCYYYRWMKAVKLSMVDAFKNLQVIIRSYIKTWEASTSTNRMHRCLYSVMKSF